MQYITWEINVSFVPDAWFRTTKWRKRFLSSWLRMNVRRALSIARWTLRLAICDVVETSQEGKNTRQRRKWDWSKALFKCSATSSIYTTQSSQQLELQQKKEERVFIRNVDAKSVRDKIISYIKHKIFTPRKYHF